MAANNNGRPHDRTLQLSIHFFESSFRHGLGVGVCIWIVTDDLLLVVFSVLGIHIHDVMDDSFVIS